MAIVRAVKSGNWSDPTVWNTGALPTSADDVYANTFTVTIDQSITVLSIRNTSATGVSVGGNFSVTASTLNINANIIASTVHCLIVSSSQLNAVITIVTNSGVIQGGSQSGGSNAINIVSPFIGTLSIVGNPTGGAGGHGVANGTTGTVNITGNVTIGTFGGLGVINASTGICNITGTIFSGLSNTSSGTINITGTVNGGAFANSSTGVITHIGTAIASNNAPAITSSNTSATVILSGPFIVSPNGTHAIYCPNWKWQDTTPPATYYQIRSANLSTIRPLYTADSVGGNPATSNVRSGTIYGPNSELTGTCAVPPAGSVALGVPVDNTTGTATLTAANVRAAVGLASANLDTQLAAIPTTAAPTAAAIRTELDTNSTKLANLDATVSSRSTYAGADTSGTTTLLNRLTSGRASALDNLDATISSRLADSSYQAPLDAAGTRSAIGLTSANLDNQLDALPTAVENAQAVRTELTTELNNLDAAVSTRSTFNPGTDTVANVTLVDTTTNLTNPPDVPTTTEIAEAVANELDPTLTTIDSNVLSRLAAADYTEPPTAEQNAGAVRTELTAELGNLDTAVSTRSTFNPATDTVANVTTVNTLTNSPDVPSESEIANAVRAELTPELERVANCATVETTGDQLAALNP